VWGCNRRELCALPPRRSRVAAKTKLPVRLLLGFSSSGGFHATKGHWDSSSKRIESAISRISQMSAQRVGSDRLRRIRPGAIRGLGLLLLVLYRELAVGTLYAISKRDRCRRLHPSSRDGYSRQTGGGVSRRSITTCYNEPLLADLSLFDEVQQQPRIAHSRGPGIHVETQSGYLR
jgi:hypothetical protein